MGACGPSTQRVEGVEKIQLPLPLEPGGGAFSALLTSEVRASVLSTNRKGKETHLRGIACQIETNELE